MIRKIFIAMLTVLTIVTTLIWSNIIPIGHDLLKGIVGTITTMLALVIFIILMYWWEDE